MQNNVFKQYLEFRHKYNNIKYLLNTVEVYKDNPLHYLFLWEMCRVSLFQIAFFKTLFYNKKPYQMNFIQNERSRIGQQNHVIQKHLRMLEKQSSPLPFKRMAQKFYTQNLFFNNQMLQALDPSYLKDWDKRIRALDDIMEHCEKRHIELTGQKIFQRIKKSDNLKLQLL